MNEPDLNDGFAYLMQGDHRAVVYGALKRLNVRPYHDYYEDLKQEGFIKFAQKYNQYDGEDKEKQRLAYIYQGVYWHLLDLLRHDSRDRQRNLAVMDNDDMDWQDCLRDPERFVENVDGAMLLTQLWKICDEKQRRYIRGSFELGMTVTEIARHWRVSRKTVYQWKQEVREKMKKVGNTFTR